MTPPRILLASDHPDMSTGFARISHLIARTLSTVGGCSVHYLSTAFSGEETLERPYTLHRIGPDPGKPVEEVLFIQAVQSCLPAQSSAPPAPLILVDAVNEQERLLAHLASAGFRNRIRAISYLPIDFSPPAEKYFALVRNVDVLVPYSEFARKALLAGLDRYGGDRQKIQTPIPHSVDSRVFRPPTPEERRFTRREVFHAGDGDMVVGFFSRNTERKRTDLALLIYFLWSLGAYVTCSEEGEVTVADLDPVDLSPTLPDRCRYCGSRDVRPGLPSPNSRLYLHAEILGTLERLTVMGWDIPEIVHAMGLEGRVITAPELRPGHGLHLKELVRRMGACDLHLLPFMGGGWELTALETGACGVPNILTDFAAPREYAQPFSILVPPEALRLRRYGVEGIMDLNRGVRALKELAASRSMREALAREGVKVAKGFDPSRIGLAWLELISQFHPPSTESHPPTPPPPVPR